MSCMTYKIIYSLMDQRTRDKLARLQDCAMVKALGRGLIMHDIQVSGVTGYRVASGSFITQILTLMKDSSSIIERMAKAHTVMRRDNGMRVNGLTMFNKDSVLKRWLMGQHTSATSKMEKSTVQAN